MSRSLLALSFTLLVACAPADVVTPVSTNQTGDWWSTVGPRLGADSRRLHAEGAAFVAALGDVEARFDYDGGVLSAPGVPALSVRLATWEAGGPVQTSGRRSPALGACQIDGAVDPAGRCLPRLEFDHGGLVEWWASTEGGPRQGFEITGAETSEVRIDIATSEAVEREGDALAIGGWLVSEFAAWDASGAALPVRVVPGARSFAMVVSVEGAQFPVTVDPLS